MQSLEPVALNIFDNRHQQITDGRDELFVFGVERVLPKIVVQVPGEMHQALLLPRALLAANLGNDADTTCAIYGQLAGAMYGLSGIPQRWLERLAMRKLIEQMADQLLALSEHLATAAPFHG